MRIGTSRADRIGFIVFAVLASVLAVLLITNINNDPAESAQEVTTFADIEPAAAVPTTEAVAMPTATPTPIPVAPAAAPVDDEPEEEADEAGVDATSSTADGDSASEGTTDAASAGNGESAAAAPAPAAESDGGSVPNPQPQTTAVPNPQPQTTAVPNPQPKTDATAVPNPQPKTDTPNPQPATNQNVSAPPANPTGGTFTHTLTATVSRPTLYNSINGSPFTPTFRGTSLPAVNPTVFGNPLVYRVLAGSPQDTSGWAQVQVPAGGNTTTAWVQTSQFRWGSSNRMLQINVGNNTVTVFEGSNVLLTTQAVTGKSSSRTPLAQGWVEEIMAGPSSAYGPRLISLGLFSNDLTSFGGSVPKIALHGTNNPSLMGQYASNGCIRVRNEIINQIAGMLPVGSKVQIVG